MSRPAGMCGVPFGETAVCQAGTSLTQPQSNLTVPPRFGSTTSMPSWPSSFASSTMATTGASVRFAMSTVSPRWSACPWVRRIVVASTSEASLAAFGFPVRNGSTSTVVEPSESVKHEWPRNVMSMELGVLPLGLQLMSQFEADGRPDEHAQPGLLGHERAERRRVGFGQDPLELRLVGVPEVPALLERRREDALELRGEMGHDVLRMLEPLGIADGLDGAVDLVGGVLDARQGRDHRPRCPSR